MSSTAAVDLAWLDTFFRALPEKRKERNIYRISGFPDRELVVSNVLAHYLDPNEGHGLGDIVLGPFLDLVAERSGKQIIGQALAGLNTQGISIAREEYTERDGGRFLDLVLRPKGALQQRGKAPWAIVIENKVHAGLYNPLDEYRKAVDADMVIGVVIAPWRMQVDDPNWHMITFGELTEKIRPRLDLETNPNLQRSRVLLDEFLTHLETYAMVHDHKIQSQRLASFQEHHQQVDALFKLRDELGRYVCNVLDAAFQLRDFRIDAGREFTETRNYLPNAVTDADVSAGLARMAVWVPVNDLLRTGRLKISFDIVGGEFFDIGIELLATIRMAQPPFKPDPCMRIPQASDAGKDYWHVALVDAEIDRAKPFDQEVERILDAALFMDQSRFVKHCIEFVENHPKKKVRP